MIFHLKYFAMFLQLIHLLISVNGNQIPIPHYGNPLSRAVTKIITEYYATTEEYLFVVKMSETEKGRIIINTVLNEIIYKSKESVAFEVDDFETVFNPTAINYLILVENVGLFKIFAQSLIEKEFTRNGFYTVALIQPVRLDALKEGFQECWKNSLVHVNVLVQDTNHPHKVNIYTYFPYSDQGCGFCHPVFYESLTDGHFAKNRTIFPPKCKHLKGCPIRVGTFSYPPFMILSPLFNETHYDGLEGILVRSLAKRMNFKPIRFYTDERWGQQFPNGTRTGVLKQLMEGIVDFGIGTLDLLTYSYEKSLHTSVPYYSFQLKLVIPPGRPYSDLVELYLPFQPVLWLFVLLCFVSMMALALVLRLCPKFVSNFIYGRNIHFPFIRMVNIFLGNCVTQLPSRNFTRFLLMLWMLASLILRSSYQGALFDFITMQASSHPLYTLDQIYKSNMTIYTSQRLANYITQADTRLTSLIKITESNELNRIAMRTLDNRFHGAVISAEPMILYNNKMLAPKGLAFFQTRDNIIGIQSVIYTKEYSCLQETINSELWQYMSAGLIDAWAERYLNGPFLKENKNQVHLDAINMDDLKGVFIIFIALLIFCVIVFLIEVVSVKCDRFKRFYEQLNS